MTRAKALLFCLIWGASCAIYRDSDQAATVSLDATVDTLISVGDHRLHVHIHRGDQPVTVLFEAGGAADLSSWGAVPGLLANTTEASIVSYDRAGLGTSELGPLELTPVEEVRSVWRALSKLAVPEPTVVVGHSYGAMLALLHAEEFASQVGALVLVDPMNPRFVAKVGDWLMTTVPKITNPTSDRERVIQRMTRTMDSLSAHLLPVEQRLDVPMWVISAGTPWWGPDDIDAAWVASHQEMVAASPRRTHIVATGTTHDIPSEAPKVIVSAIDQALEHITSSNRTNSRGP